MLRYQYYRLMVWGTAVAEFMIDVDAVTGQAAALAGYADRADQQGMSDASQCGSALAAAAASNITEWYVANRTRAGDGIKTSSMRASDAANAQRATDAEVSRGTAPRGSWVV